MKCLSLLLSVFVLPLLARADELPPPYSLYEVRTYHAHEGKLEALHARFRDHTVKLFEEALMQNVIYLDPVENEGDTLTYVLAYFSRDQRDAAWKRFLGNPEWKAAYKASIADGKLVKKIDSVFYEPTDYSPQYSQAFPRSFSKDKRLFEWRTYSTREGKLDDLDARFRDHTCGLFKKHGMANILYLHPVKGQPGHGNTLTYLIAHRDKAARDASFDAFRVDPAWQAARKASEADGKILEKGGVSNAFFHPTDYSPIR